MSSSPPLLPSFERRVGVAVVTAAFHPSLLRSFFGFVMPECGTWDSVNANIWASSWFSLRNF
eukprot:2227552-Pyramimonas_sp.AAC.1